MAEKAWSRFWELDALRGVAVVLMVLYHVVWDAVFFDVWQFNLANSPIEPLARIIPILFLTLLGVGLYLSYYKRQARAHVASFFVKRGLSIFGIGLLITLITIWVIPAAPIYFGILHLIGVSILLAYPVLRARGPVWLLIPVVFFSGWLVSLLNSSSWVGLPIGVIPEGFASLDYFPILPWFGFVVLGIMLGQKFYAQHERQFKLKNLSHLPVIRVCVWLGQRALPIYVFHQPLSWGIFLIIRQF